MGHKKTAVSIDEEILKDIDYLSKTTNVPRSRLFEEGAILLIEKRKKPVLLRRLNEIYKDKPEKTENDWLKASSLSHSRLLQKEENKW